VRGKIKDCAALGSRQASGRPQHLKALRKHSGWCHVAVKRGKKFRPDRLDSRASKLLPNNDACKGAECVPGGTLLIAVIKRWRATPRNYAL